MSDRITISADQLEEVSGVGHPRPMGQPEWFQEVARQFRAIAKLPHGWDSYGSPPPDKSKLDAAWVLLWRLTTISDFPKPHVNPIPDGGVQFHWEEGARYFEIVVAEEDAATYLFRDDDVVLEETGDVSEAERLVDYVQRVAVGCQKTRTSAIRSRSFVECERDLVAVG